MHPVVCLLAGACLLAPGWLIAEEAAPKASPTLTAPPAASAPAAVDPKVIEVLRQAFAAQQAMKSFRARMRLPDAPTGSPGEVEMEFIHPDRVRLKMAGMVIVMVGEKAFVQMGDKWMPAPEHIAKAGLLAGDPKKMIDDVVRTCQSARHLGLETVNGVAMETYEVTTKRKEGPMKSKFYLTVNDLLIRRVDVEIDRKGQKQKSTHEFYDYGAPLTIELPQGV